MKFSLRSLVRHYIAWGIIDALDLKPLIRTLFITLIKRSGGDN